MYNKRLWHSLPLAGTQTCARLRHFCTHVCAPYLEVTTVRFWHNSEVFAHFIIMLFKLTAILLVPTKQETTYGNSNSYTLE